MIIYIDNILNTGIEHDYKQESIHRLILQWVTYHLFNRSESKQKKTHKKKKKKQQQQQQEFYL